MDALIAAMCAPLASDSLTSDDCTTPAYMPDPGREYGWRGPFCRDIGMNRQADQQEAACYFAVPRKLEAEQIFAVVSTLGTETGNATYVALSLNDASMMAGVTNVLDSDLETPPGVFIKGLGGSADSYADVLEHDSKLFFLHFFARDCASLDGVPTAKDTCSVIPTDLLPEGKGDPAPKDVFILGLRNYIAVDTARGLDSSKLSTPRIFTFSKP